MDTSTAALATVDVASLRALVLRLLRTYGPLTVHEAAAHGEIPVPSIQSRLSELNCPGRIVDPDERRANTPSGRLAGRGRRRSLGVRGVEFRRLSVAAVAARWVVSASARRARVVPGALAAVAAVGCATSCAPRRASVVAARLAPTDGSPVFADALVLAQAERPTVVGVTHWPLDGGRPLRVWVAPPRAAPTLPAGRRAAVLRALEAWQSTGIPVRFTVLPDSSPADVTVQWTDRFSNARTGLARFWTGADGWSLVRVVVTLADRHCDGTPLDSGEVDAIALHEIGHALGLGHAADSASIMAPFVRARALGLADAATVRRLYALTPGARAGLHGPPPRASDPSVSGGCTPVADAGRSTAGS